MLSASHVYPSARRATRLATCLAAGALSVGALAGCSGSTSGTSASDSSAAAAPSTLAATADTSGAGAADAADAEATQATRESSAGIAALGNADTAMKTRRAEAPAQLLVTGVRLGDHDTFTRVVFDLEGQGTPGWFVDFAQDPHQQGSGNAITYKGATALNVNIDGTVLPFEVNREDPNIGTVAGQGSVTEVVSAGTFEGRSQFVVGLDGEHPYSVQTLSDPTRLVIDIQR